MRYKVHTPRNSFPRLVIERSETSPAETIGFLQIQSGYKGICLGSTEGREFRLMQCLFSPHNFMSAKYEPVAQTHERVFDAIATNTDARNTRLASQENADREMVSVVERSLRTLQKGEVGKYFSFTSQEGRVYMSRV